MDSYLSTPRVTRAADAIMDQIERLILEGKVRRAEVTVRTKPCGRVLMCLGRLFEKRSRSLRLGA